MQIWGCYCRLGMHECFSLHTVYCNTTASKHNCSPYLLLLYAAVVGPNLTAPDTTALCNVSTACGHC